MTDSTDFLQFHIKYHCIRLKLSKLYSLQEYHVFSIQNGIFAVTKSVISYDSFNLAEISLNIWQFQIILYNFEWGKTVHDFSLLRSIHCKKIPLTCNFPRVCLGNSFATVAAKLISSAIMPSDGHYFRDGKCPGGKCLGGKCPSMKYLCKKI